MIDFSGQEVLVIGGTSGIGFATASLAAASGAEVTIASRSAGKAHRKATEIGSAAVGRVIDLTSDRSVEEFFGDVTVWDHIIVTGSQVTNTPVRTSSMDEAMAVFNSRYWGFYRVARSAQIRPGGSLGVIAGFLATRPSAMPALIGSINGALEGLVQGLALEMKPVRVNAVSAAMVNTEIWTAAAPEDRDAMLAKVAASHPAGGVAEPDDIARQLLVLAATPDVTGTIVTLDGGASIA